MNSRNPWNFRILAQTVKMGKYKRRNFLSSNREFIYKIKYLQYIYIYSMSRVYSIALALKSPHNSPLQELRAIWYASTFIRSHQTGLLIRQQEARANSQINWMKQIWLLYHKSWQRLCSFYVYVWQSDSHPRYTTRMLCKECNIDIVYYRKLNSHRVWGKCLSRHLA